MIQGLVQIFLFQVLGELISRWLAPMIPGPVWGLVALAVPIFKGWSSLKGRFIPLTLALAAGGFTSIVTAVATAQMMGVDAALVKGFYAKSVTAPIAMGISDRIGASPTLTAIFAVSTGILGAILARSVFNLIQIKAWWQRGFALGVAAHGIGTSRAFSVHPQAGAYASLGMGMHGILGAVLIPLLLGFLPQAHAGQYLLQAGQNNRISVAVDVKNKMPACHVEFRMGEQTIADAVVRAPDYIAMLDVKPDQAGQITLAWQGQFKRTEAEVINACPTMGSKEFQVVNDNQALLSRWNSYFQAQNPNHARCVINSLPRYGVRLEWYDNQSETSSPEDLVFSKIAKGCQGFLSAKKVWGSMNPENFSCTLADGLKTRCHGIYLALSGAGKQQTITAEQALDREMKGLPWTTGMQETAAGKAARAKAQQLASAQQAAKEAAELKALADEKLAQEEKAAAELKAQQEKEEEEKKQKIEERKRKRQERLENRPWLVKLLSPE